MSLEIEPVTKPLEISVSQFQLGQAESRAEDLRQGISKGASQRGRWECVFLNMVDALSKGQTVKCVPLPDPRQPGRFIGARWESPNSSLWGFDISSADGPLRFLLGTDEVDTVRGPMRDALLAGREVVVKTGPERYSPPIASPVIRG